MTITSAVSEIISILGISENAIGILFFPFFEELFKYFTAKRCIRYSFKLIFLFAIYELFLIKIPMLDWNFSFENLANFAFTILAFNFHISTAFIYNRKEFFFAPITTLFAMIILHIAYNSFATFDVSLQNSLIVLLIFSLSPYIWLLRFRWTRFRLRWRFGRQIMGITSYCEDFNIPHF